MKNVLVKGKFHFSKDTLTFELPQEGIPSKDIAAILQEIAPMLSQYRGSVAASAAIHKTAKPIESETSFESTLQIPTFLQIRDFIRQQPDFKHSLNDIANRFIGRSVSSLKDFALYHKLYDRMLRAQKSINHAPHSNGRFVAIVSPARKGNGEAANRPYKTYIFKKSTHQVLHQVTMDEAYSQLSKTANAP